MGFLHKLFGIDEVEAKSKKILKEIFSLLEFDVKFSSFDEHSGKKRLNLIYNKDDVNVLVGKNGKNIMALENFLNIILNKKLERKDVQIMLDVNDYRKNKELFLKDIALKAGEEVLKTRKNVVLRPLNSYERKIVHTTLKKIKNVKTKSLGNGDLKKILVTYNEDIK
jgi:spoIIIJ-associated protein